MSRPRSRPDPGGRDRAYPHALDLPVLGVPTRFACERASLVEQVEEAFGAWRALDGRPDLVAAARVTVRISLGAAAPDDAGAPPVRYRTSQDGCLEVTTPGSAGRADLSTGEARVRVSPELVDEAAHFRYAVLSALTLFLVTRHDRRPVHAGAVAGATGALLLHGPSGVGKSTLALACARRGLGVLAEDAVYAQVDGTFRIWGYPGPLHLSRDALGFFPGVEPGRAVVRTGGVTKLAVPLPAGAVDPIPVRDRAGICLVRASAGAPRVGPADAAEVERVVARPDEPGFDAFRGRMDEVAARLTAGGAWVLHVGSDPMAAACTVAELLAEVERG